MFSGAEYFSFSFFQNFLVQQAAYRLDARFKLWNRLFYYNFFFFFIKRQALNLLFFHFHPSRIDSELIEIRIA